MDEIVFLFQWFVDEKWLCDTAAKNKKRSKRVFVSDCDSWGTKNIFDIIIVNHLLESKKVVWSTKDNSLVLVAKKGDIQ